MVPPAHYAKTRVDLFRKSTVPEDVISGTDDSSGPRGLCEESWLYLDTDMIEHLPVFSVSKNMLLSLTCLNDDGDTGYVYGEQDSPLMETETPILSGGITRTNLRSSSCKLPGSGVDINGY